MKQKLQFGLAQHLALTPQLQQSIRLLQLSSQELNQELEEALQENPLLERVDDPLANSTRLSGDGSVVSVTRQAEAGTDTDQNDHSINRSQDISDSEEHSGDMESMDNLWTVPAPSERQPDDERSKPQIEAPSESLRDHLLSQMRLSVINQRQRALVELIIDALDANGFLQETLPEMLEWLPPELDISIKELEEALSCVQDFEPAGVGARTSSECLGIQIRLMPHVPYVVRKRAMNIVENYLDLFARHDFVHLKKVLDCDDEDLKEAQEVIHRCNPHPGAAYSTDTAETVIPEIIVSKKNNSWIAELNPAAMPKIQVNQLYANILKNSDNRALLSIQLREAKWLIRNVNQRFETILKTSRAIVERQQNFFSFGPTSMRPLVLREIADTLGLHESTISRVTNQKFMRTPHGILELKYFFGSSVATETGGEASSTAIREKIRQLINAEDKKKPHSDNKIARLLENQGLIVARRTVAKYRDILKIPSATLRKKL